MGGDPRDIRSPSGLGAPELTDGTPPEVRVPAPDLEATLGRYQVGELLGSGGMGSVYRARDPLLGRTVALKVLRAGTAGDPAQLVAEARAMAKLSHPGIVTIYEAGIEDGHVYLALELVDGPTLRGWLAAHPRTRREIVAVFAAAGRGLAAAHRAGLVHRDFKPDNVLVGNDGRVRVGDFGLAATTGAEGAIAGTPAYMSPEQHRGLAATASSDQFSFCVTLDEALHGRRPFAGTGLEELRANVLGQRLEPPRARVPRLLRAAVERGLDVDPEARFPSMDALVDTLERRPWTRSRVVLASTVVVVAALGVVAYGATRTPAAAPAKLRCTGTQARAALVDVWDDGVRSRVRQGFTAAGLPGGYAAVATRLDAYTREWVEGKRQLCLAAEAAQQRPGHNECLMRLRSRLKATTALLARPTRARVERAAGVIDRLEPISTCDAGSASSRVVLGPTGAEGRRRLKEMELELDRVQALERFGEIEAALALVRASIEKTRDMTRNPARADALLFAGRLERAAGDPGAAGHLEAALTEAALIGDAGAATEAFAELVTLAPRPSGLRCPTDALHAAIFRLEAPPCGP